MGRSLMAWSSSLRWEGEQGMEFIFRRMTRAEEMTLMGREEEGCPGTRYGLMEGELMLCLAISICFSVSAVASSMPRLVFSPQASSVTALTMERRLARSMMSINETAHMDVPMRVVTPMMMEEMRDQVAMRLSVVRSHGGIMNKPYVGVY